MSAPVEQSVEQTVAGQTLPPQIGSEAQAQDWLRSTLGVDDATMARLTHLVDLLVEENERQNLIARGTIPMVWQRHIVDSAQLLAVPRETVPDGSWLDLGTGAGFPGLVVAALQPERPVTLVPAANRVVAARRGCARPVARFGGARPGRRSARTAPCRAVCPGFCTARQTAFDFGAFFHTRNLVVAAKGGEGCAGIGYTA